MGLAVAVGLAVPVRVLEAVSEAVPEVERVGNGEARGQKGGTRKKRQKGVR